MVRWCVIVVLLLCGGAQPAQASAELAAVLLKAMGYERNLEKRAEEVVVIAVVGPASHGPTASMHDSLSKLAGLAIQDRKLRIERVVIDENFQGRLKEIGVDFIGVPDRLSSQRFDDVLRVSRELKIPSVTMSAEDVRRGVSMGVGVVRRKPRIYINMAASREQGANYSSDLLQLATRI